MKRSLFDKLASAVGVKNTSNSPSSPSEAEVSANVSSVLQPLMLELKKRAEHYKQVGGQELQRAKLIELILPSVFTHATDLVPDKTATKEWAFSLGQTLGLLAGIAIPKDRMVGAIDEIVREAKRVAEMVDQEATALGLHKKASAPAPTTNAGAMEQGKKEERERTIQNLLDEATLTTEPAAKVALEAMANRLKKEIELDGFSKQVS